MSTIASNCIANLVVTLNGVTSSGSTNLNCSLNPQTGSPLSSMFSLNSKTNELMIAAPQNTPAQINYTLRAHSVAGVNLNLSNIVLKNQTTVQCSYRNNPGSSAITWNVPSGYSTLVLNVPAQGLAVLDWNYAPPKSGGYTLAYTLQFTSAGGTTYSWDPEFENEQP